MRSWVVWILVVLFLFAGLGQVPLFDKDEGAFSEASREMLVSGDYIMTYLNGEPRYDKPVLIYWLQVASMKVFGVNEFAVRFPSAVAALVWFATVYRFALRMFGRETAIVALVCMVASLQVSTIAKAAIADSLLNACIAVALFALWDAVQENKNGARYIAWIAMAVGFLTKGPLAFMIPLATVILFGLWERRFREVAARTFHWKPIVVFLCLAIPWYIAAYIDQGQDLLDAYYDQTIGRVMSPMEGHGGGGLVWSAYYFFVVPLGVMPFTVPFVQTFLGLRKGQPDSFTRFAVACFAFNFIFWTLSSTKLPHYAIYGYTPLIVLVANRIASYDRNQIVFTAVPTLVLLSVFATLPMVLPMAAGIADDAFALAVMDYGAESLGWTLPIAALIAIATTVASLVFSKMRSSTRFVVAGAVFTATIHFALMPTVGRIMQQPIKEAALHAREHDLDVVLHDFVMPSFIFYRGELCEDRFPRRGEVFVAKVGETDRLEPYEKLYEKGGIILGRREK